MRVLGCAPAYLVQLIASLISIYAITRILPPEQYGLYALLMSLMLPVQSVLFAWSDLGLKRFFARVQADGQLPVLSLTVYCGLAGSSVVLLGICGLSLTTDAPRTALGSLIWFGAGALIFRQASLISKTFHLLDGARGRFTAMECLESVLGVGTGIAACFWLGMGPAGVFAGMIIGSVAVLAWDAPLICQRLRHGHFDLQLQWHILAFAGPVAIGFLMEYVLASADRLLVELYLGTGSVGIYAVSYSLAERAVSAAFLAVGLAAYPMIMDAQAQGGAPAVRRRVRECAEILLIIALPAWGGFTIASGHIAAVLVGPAYAATAAQLMPLAGLAIFLYALRVHYFNYALHLVSRTHLGLLSSVPAAAIALLLNVILLPRIGLIGAVWASVISYAVALAISIAQAMRHYPLPFPLAVAGKAAAATVIMCLGLRMLPFPASATGLVAMIATGALIYGALVMVLDIAGSRTRITGLLASRLPG
ncbi:MAG: lipopolysaccharide biosynthesis protein [Acetobacteraceae bacterium]